MDQTINSTEVNKRASIPPPSEDEFENIFVADGSIAATQPQVMSMHVREIQKFKKSFLRKLRPEMHGKRGDWERFVAIKVEANNGMSMYPRLLPGATVLIDRHYNSLQPYRKGELNMYAVNLKGSSIIRYVELAGRNMVLRPHNQAYSVEVLPLGEGENVWDYLVGRVSHIAIET